MKRVSSAQMKGMTLSFRTEMQQISAALFRKIVDLLGMM
jgi:hypothetical protein